MAPCGTLPPQPAATRTARPRASASATRASFFMNGLFRELGKSDSVSFEYSIECRTHPIEDVRRFITLMGGQRAFLLEVRVLLAGGAHGRGPLVAESQALDLQPAAAIDHGGHAQSRRLQSYRLQRQQALDRIRRRAETVGELGADLV